MLQVCVAVCTMSTSLLGENSSSRLHRVEEAITRTSSGAFCNNLIKQEHTILLPIRLIYFEIHKDTQIKGAIYSNTNIISFSTDVQRRALSALTKTCLL